MGRPSFIGRLADRTNCTVAGLPFSPRHYSRGRTSREGGDRVETFIFAYRWGTNGPSSIHHFCFQCWCVDRDTATTTRTKNNKEQCGHTDLSGDELATITVRGLDSVRVAVAESGFVLVRVGAFSNDVGFGYVACGIQSFVPTLERSCFRKDECDDRSQHSVAVCACQRRGYNV